jgi:vitamin B12 transporter
MGIRVDYLDINREIDISPRFSVSYNLSPDLKLSGAWGIFNKAPLMKQLKYDYTTSANTKSQKSIHYLAGIERRKNNTTIKIETYYKKYDDLIPMRRTAMSRIIYDIKENIAEGFAAGFDFQFVFTRPFADIWFNYSLATSKERLKGTKDYYSRYTDQTNTVSALFLFKFRHNYEFGTKITYGSGYTFQEKYFDAANLQWLPYSPVKTGNLPYFLSLDLRFRKLFRLFSFPVQFYADVINCLDRRNSIGHEFRIRDGKPYEENFRFYGIVPTFGIMLDF